MKFPRIRFCPTCASDVSMGGLARKTLSVTAAVLLGFAILPTSRAQMDTPDSVRIEELRRRVNMLDDVSTKLGALGERVNGIAEGQKALQAQVDSMSSRAWAAMVAAIIMLLERVFAAFGVQIKGRSAE
jgi:hypothetical protein